MYFCKILKNKPYYSRFRVKWKRRRESKTDYQFRKKMISQDKRKYKSPKHRIVVRVLKHTIICQFIKSKIEGDCIKNFTYSNCLKKFGIFFGLTNFSSCYNCGLILSNHILKKQFSKTKNEHQASKCIVKKIRTFLDIGLTCATVGHRVFGCMKGILDGGIDVPHEESKYPGYSIKKEFNSLLLNSRIEGSHIYNYMINLREEDEKKFHKHFSSLAKYKISPLDIKKSHSSILSKFL